MREYPEHLNSKQDYLNMLDFDKAETVRRLENLLKTRFHWVRGKELGENEEGIEDETHSVHVVMEMADFDTDIDLRAKRIQYELQESKSSHLFRLGFTVEEVEQLIKEKSE
ncbi:Uncharacterised protein [Candidatus Bartonella washoeensis]|uniref:hypothetical protein n=1 Tax=Candidatus Bartonella washoeensis TaxID=186739 RepID=UPI000D898ABC|nr:hypothetical protein [Bartonella washoeensis]SPU27789.1 Uncharacterised protein [Bartonella washoeensis]SPU27857.1 Uncharacterised protein [Bartonella washoeensis]